jgi:outer membrane protein OmpA-like peptidoglycan-associated protein
VNPGGTLTMPSTNVVLVASWVTRANVSGGNQSNPSTSPSPSQSTTPAPKKLTETVYFSGDSAKLLPKTKALLKSLATKAKKFGVVTKIDVIGRVKETADKSYDMRLSRQRATNVANYLKKLGVKGTFLIKAAGISPENKPISRRVNIFLFWNK